MEGFPSQAPSSRMSRMSKTTRRQARRAFKALMRSYPMHIPKYDMPLRIRPWFILLTVLVMATLSVLGFTNLAHSLPINDKVLHFVCLGIATGVFYFIWDVEEYVLQYLSYSASNLLCGLFLSSIALQREARRVWFWRRSALILSLVVCLGFGGIVSEFVQGLLPYKQFQFGDIVANLLGSSIGLYVAYHLERYYRHRREISRLYRPLSASLSSLTLHSDLSDEEEPYDDVGGTQLLPLHYSSQPSPTDPKGKGKGKGKTRAKRRESALADVWDEREEDGLVFGVGEDSDGDLSEEEAPSRIELSNGKTGKTGKQGLNGSQDDERTPKAVRFADPPERSSGEGSLV
ncbi:hypothetical protein EVG20_g4400 [Dentipellis fragilis]|uniref:VanZ-like domain-containing protein n=1 Tax=Dentipellis fragilis TaxID=205917 RepID=A0A4Y9YW80_9AGAM|nr:hypothetical protein EVG20_g4400 [Dentipellis fragilis]